MKVAVCGSALLFLTMPRVELIQKLTEVDKRVLLLSLEININVLTNANLTAARKLFNAP